MEKGSSQYSSFSKSIQMGKELHENLQSQDVFEVINTLQTDRLQMTLNYQHVNMIVNIISCMLDRKASDLFQGLGGAYCEL